MKILVLAWLLLCATCKLLISTRFGKPTALQWKVCGKWQHWQATGVLNGVMITWIKRHASRSTAKPQANELITFLPPPTICSMSRSHSQASGI